MNPEYHLVSVATKEVLEDVVDADSGNMPLVLPHAEEPSLLRAKYAKKRIAFGDSAEGLFRFSDWLPVNKRRVQCGCPISYKSSALASHLALENLYISFSGYWPERSATLSTASFKECEAASVLNRFPEDFSGLSLVVASAGNTARAFIHWASKISFPLLVVIPEQNLPALWLSSPQGASVDILAVKGGDYYDAISVAQDICKDPSYLPEGGAKNVARRDGMGTSFLAGVECMGRIPQHYFQAVGSGTGAIAAWEAAIRLQEDGRWQDTVPALHLSQNEPFLLLYHSWKRRTRSLMPLDDADGRAQTDRIYAKVLANRHPPYSLRGGLYDALSATKGTMYRVSNDEARTAQALFEEHEGIDIDPAAAVACASLMHAVEEKRLRPDDFILLNITGGGMKKFRDTHRIYMAEPTLTFALEQRDEIVAELHHRKKRT